MQFIKLKYILTALISVLIGVSLFSVVLSTYVHKLKVDVSNLQQDILSRKELMQKFKAEWSYLNDAEYLEKMRKKYFKDLNSKSLNSSKIIDVEEYDD